MDGPGAMSEDAAGRWAAHDRSERRRRRVVAGVCIAAALTISGIVFAPSILRMSISSSETRAVVALHRLADAQESFRASRARDLDRDGCGEYGYFEDLARADLFDKEFAESVVENDGDAIVRGYRFRIYLPRADGLAERERRVPPAFEPADAGVQEANWVCYAWPERLDRTGNRAFVMNQEGQFYQCSNASNRWGGDDGPRSGDEAFRPGEDMTGPIDVGGPGKAGDAWIPV